MSEYEAACQDEYCASEHCDLGRGTCQVCVQVAAGAHLCGSCGGPMPDRSPARR